MNEQLGLVAISQIRKVGTVQRSAQADQLSHTLVRACDAQSNPGTKTKTGQEQRKAWKLGGQEIQRGFHISLLATSAIVCTRTHSRAAKIKSQHRYAECIQR